MTPDFGWHEIALAALSLLSGLLVKFYSDLRNENKDLGAKLEKAVDALEAEDKAMAAAFSALQIKLVEDFVHRVMMERMELNISDRDSRIEKRFDKLDDLMGKISDKLDGKADKI